MEKHEEYAKIIKVIKSYPRGLTVKDIAEKIGVSRQSVSKYLDVLQASGQLEMRALGPSKLFYLSQRVPISAMLSFSSDFIISLDDQLLVSQVNDRFLMFAEIDRDNIIGIPVMSHRIPLISHPEILSKLRDALEGSEINIQNINVRKKGEDYYFMANLVPTIFNEGSKGVTAIFIDITKIKKAELALKESEARYKAIIDEQMDVVFRTTTEGIVTFANQPACKLLGVPYEEIVGTSLGKTLSENFFKDLTDNYVNIRPDNPVYITDHPYVMPDSTIRWYQLVNRGIFSDNGRLKEIQVVGRDITDKKIACDSLEMAKEKLELKVKERTVDLENVNRLLREEIEARKEVENALRNREFLFRAMFDNAAIGIVLTDNKGHPIDYNKKFLELIGYEKDHLEKMSILDITHPDDHEKEKELFKKLLIDRQIKNGQIEKRYVKKDGTVFWVNNMVSTIEDRDGIPSVLICMVEDISKRKEIEEALSKSEERFRNVINSIDDVVFTLDTGQRHVEIFGNSLEKNNLSRKMFIGKRIRDIIGDKLAEPHEKANESALSGKSVTYVWSIGLKDGKKLHFQTTLSPIHDCSGNVTGIVGISRDITGLKTAEEEIIRSRDYLLRYKLLFENALDIILFVDMKGRIIDANDAAVKAYGYTKDELLSLSINDTRFTDPVPVITSQMSVASKEGIHFKTVHHRKDGSTFPVEVNSRGAMVGDRRILMSIVRDVSAGIR